MEIIGTANYISISFTVKPPSYAGCELMSTGLVSKAIEIVRSGE